MITIKKYIINKANVLIMCIILLTVFCLIPTNNMKIQEEEPKKIKSNIYLLDEDNYVSMVSYYFDEKTIKELIEEKINILINGIPANNFTPLIPKNTKVNKIDINKNSLYIDFSKEILDVNEYYEEEMIESIVYSLSDINGIDNIYITINNEELKQLPNSKKELPYPLNRNYGINKEYKINDLKNINKTTIVFAKTNNDISYYVPITKITNNENEKISIIIEELKSSVNSQLGLIGYIKDDTKLIDSYIEEENMILVFSDENNKEYEEFISLSIKENYKIKDVIYKYEEKKEKIE